MSPSGNTRWLERLKAVECSDATYPAVDPALVFTAGEGSWLYDVEGRGYLDLCAGFGVAALGHNPREIAAAYERRLPGVTRPPIVHGMGDVYASRAKVELLETLTAALPEDLGVVSLSLTGGQAVETAVKSAILATRSTGFIAFEGAYHGVDLGILPLTAREDFGKPFAGWQREGRVIRLPFGAGRGAIEEAIQVLKARGAGFAGIITEPVQGRAGVRLAPEGWLKMLRDACRAHGGLLIYDEVFTGLGRTGRLTHAVETPCDLLCLGKALGGGFPVSACVGTREAMHGWPDSKGEALHTGTFFGHPFSCEVAALTLCAIIAQRLPERAGRLGDEARARLAASLAPHAVAVRGSGLMMAIELRSAGDGARAMDRLRREGVVALASGERGECLQITPALNIPEDLLDEALARVERVVSAL